MFSPEWYKGKILTKHHYKGSGGDGIPAELFQMLKHDAVEVLHLICQQIWKTKQWPQNWKRSVFILIPKRGNVKECSNYCTIALIPHTSKVMLKIVQARLQQYMNHELPHNTNRKRRFWWSKMTKIHLFQKWINCLAWLSCLPCNII